MIILYSGNCQILWINRINNSAGSEIGFLFLSSCNVFYIFLIHTTFQSVINTKWLNFILTCGTNILERAGDVTMKRSLTILFQIFLICTLFSNAWGLTNYERCVKAYEDKDFPNAYNICKEVVEPNAHFIIGEMYYNGLGVKEDHAEAAIWIRKAAEQGNPEAQYVIGQMYYYGLGVKEDYEEAIIWVRKAAKKGHVRARVLRDKMLDKDKSK